MKNIFQISNKKILLLLCICLLFTLGCKEKSLKSSTYSKEYVEAEDYDPTGFSWIFRPDTIAETDSEIYLKAGNYLFLLDKDNLNISPLCYKSECLHYNETDSARIPECNAFFGMYNDFRSVSYYKDKLYLISIASNPLRFDLIEMNKDGSGRKTILEDIAGAGMLNGNNILIHRGVIYYVCQTYTAEGVAENTLYGISLVSGNRKPKILHSTEKNIDALLPYLNSVFFSVSESDDNAGNSGNIYLMEYDLITGEVNNCITDPNYSLHGAYNNKLVLRKDSSYWTYDLNTKCVEKEEESLNIFSKSYPTWNCHAECIEDDFSLFTCYDREAGNMIPDLMVADKEGKNVCRIEGEAWFGINGGEMVTIKGNEYYLKFSAGYEPFSIMLYKKTDLLEGNVNPVIILETPHFEDLSRPFIFSTN